MTFHSFTTLTVTITLFVVVVGAVIDVSKRRIPNAITLPALGIGLLVGSINGGWWGFLTALLGAVLAPGLLMALRLGNRIGMGDLKLAAAVGALLGPAVGALAILLSTITGGLLAIVWMLRPGSMFAHTISPFLIGIPILGKRYASAPLDDTPTANVTIPYGVAIGIGTLVAIATAGSL